MFPKTTTSSSPLALADQFPPPSGTALTSSSSGESSRRSPVFSRQQAEGSRANLCTDSSLLTPDDRRLTTQCLSPFRIPPFFLHLDRPFRHILGGGAPVRVGV